jgi:hypothetical protein
MTAEVTLKPTRVRRSDGKWVRADAELTRNPDGSVSPIAATLPIVFSGGGTGPAVRITKGDKELELTWKGPHALPAPALTGTHAIYSDVYPGIDLRLTADVEGFSEVLIVKTREAAKNAALEKLSFGTATKGLALKTDPISGAVSAVDSNGTLVFGGSTPTMWDSTGNRGKSNADKGKQRDSGKKSPVKQRAMRTEISPGELVVRPDLSLLSAPDTTYPVYVDPTFPGGRNHWTMLWQELENTSFWDRTCVMCDSTESDQGVVRAGFQDWDGVSTVRSLFEMDTRAVAGKQLLKATFSITQTWSGKACGGTAGATSLWWTGPINSGMTWKSSNGLNWIKKMDSNKEVRRFNGSDECTKGRVEWDAYEAVQAAMSTNAGSTTVGLMADNESDKYSWRRYQLDPVLSIEYNSQPNMPDNLNVASTPQEPGFGCATGSNRPYVRTLTPVLRGRVTDPDGDVLKEVWFAWQKLDPVTSAFSDVANTHLDNVPSNSIAQITATGLTGDGIYNFRMQDNDGRLVSPLTSQPYCEFGIDTVAPSPPSSVTSTSYPDDGSFHGGVGKTGDFHIAPPEAGADDVDHYVYALTPYTTPPTDGTRTVPAAADHSATVQINPLMGGLNDLRVWSVDKAGNTSPLTAPVTYRFRVDDPAGPVAAWTADEQAGATVLADQSGHGHDAAASSVTFGVPSRIMEGPVAARFNGASSYAVTTGPVVDTARSFTVAGWVRLSSTSSFQQAVSFGGVHQSSFCLYFDKNLNKWGFAARPADVPVNSGGPFVLSTSPVAINQWTHLAGIYDSAAGQMRFYVNGKLSGSVAYSSGWTAAGPVQIGRFFQDDAWSGYWNGDLDDLRVYDRIVDDEELANLAEATLAASWTFDEGSGDTAWDETGRHDATLAGGAAFTTSGHNQQNTGDPGSIHFDGVGAYAATTGPVVDTGRSFTVAGWVRLSSTSSFQQAVSFGGVHQSSFCLYFDKNLNKWGFAARPADVKVNTGGPSVLSTSPATTDEWVHLAGIYDSAAGQMRLYVNGQLNGSVAYSSGWTAAGPVQIGRFFQDDAWSGYWNGDLDNIRVYQGTLSPEEITALALF